MPSRSAKGHGSRVSDLQHPGKTTRNDLVASALAVTSSILSDDCTPAQRSRLVNSIFDTMGVLINSSERYDEEYVVAGRQCVRALVHLGIDFFKVRPRLFERLKASLPFIRTQVIYTLNFLAESKEQLTASDAAELLEDAWSSVQLSLKAMALDGGEYQLWSDLDMFIAAASVWLEDWKARGNKLTANLLSMCISLPNNRMTSPSEDRVMKRRTLLGLCFSKKGLSADGIVRLALTHLRRSSAPVENMFDDISIIVFLLGSINTENVQEFDPLLRAFERHGGISVLLISLDKILKSGNVDVDNPNPSDSPNLNAKFIPLLSACLSAFPLGFACARSYTTITQSLNRDLIRLLACCSIQCIYSQLAEVDRARICSTLVSSVSEAFVVRQVVQTAQSAITKYQRSKGREEMDEYKLSDVFPSLMESDARDDWETFFSRLRHQSSCFRAIARERIDEVHSCGNPICSARGTKSELYRCAGCYSIFFCSRKCQRASWRNHGHKTNCPRYRAALEATGLDYQDADFMIRFAQEDARRRVCAMMTEPRNRFAGPPPRIGVSVSFTGSRAGGTFRVEHDELFADDVCVMPSQYHPSPSNVMREDRCRVAETDDDGGVQTLLWIKYLLGTDERAVKVRTVMSRATFQGKECSCCRFHVDEDSGSMNGCDCEEIDGEVRGCLVHSKNY